MTRQMSLVHKMRSVRWVRGGVLVRAVTRKCGWLGSTKCGWLGVPPVDPNAKVKEVAKPAKAKKGKQPNAAAAAPLGRPLVYFHVPEGEAGPSGANNAR